MMEATEVKQEAGQAAAPAKEESSRCAAPAKPARARFWLIGGAVLAAGGAAAVYGGWDWLVASGTGAVLLGLAPCIAMCALGLCMGGKRKS